MRNFFPYILLSSLFFLPLHAHGPTRQQVSESIVINSPVNKVWELVGDFSGLHKWHPAILSTEMKGEDVRILSLEGDKTITEKLVKRDDEKKMLKYKITDMTTVETFEFAGSSVERKILPVNTYTGFLTVMAEGEGSKVNWKGKFYRPYLLNPPTPKGMSDKESTSVISSIYRAGLDNLKIVMETGGVDSAVAPVPSTDTPSSPTASAAPTPPTSDSTPPSKASAPTPPSQTSDKPASPKAPEVPAEVVAIKVAKEKAKATSNTKVDFDSADPYQSHVKCEEGKKCKVDKFLLKGFRTFSQCQVCHGMDGEGSTFAPSLLDKLKGEVTYDVFIERVTNGFKGQLGVMPAWKENPNIMKNIDNLYGYLKARSDAVIPAGRLKKFKH